MQTYLADFIKHTPEGKEAAAILHKCVRCGFCTATCPTYQLLGDELDGPRGRIDIIRQTLEGAPVAAKTQLHLDRCLLCRLCETTCPSGVQYGRLLDIGRRIVEERVKRSSFESFKRTALRAVVPNPALFNAVLRLAQLMHPLLPASLKRKVPASCAIAKPWPKGMGDETQWNTEPFDGASSDMGNNAANWLNMGFPLVLGNYSGRFTLMPPQDNILAPCPSKRTCQDGKPESREPQEIYGVSSEKRGAWKNDRTAGEDEDLQQGSKREGAGDTLCIFQSGAFNV